MSLVVHIHPLSNSAGTPQRAISAAAGIALGSGTVWLRVLCLKLAARGALLPGAATQNHRGGA